MINLRNGAVPDDGALGEAMFFAKLPEVQRVADRVCNSDVSGLLCDSNRTQTVATWDARISTVCDEQLHHVLAADSHGEVERRLALVRFLERRPLRTHCNTKKTRRTALG